MNKRLLNITLLALVLAACGQDGVDNGPDPQPDVVPPSVDALALSTQVNTSISTTVEVANEGDAPLTILDTASDSGWLDVEPPLGDTIPAGSSGQVTITASCGSDTGERQGTVFIEHDDPDEEEIVLDVTLSCGDSDGEEPTSSFDIELVYYGDPGPTSSQRDLFESAAARWASVIASDLPSQDVNKEEDECGVGAPAFSGEVDDVLIFATITDIDGSGGIQAEAGPCLTRSDDLPLWGAMRFDEADLDALEGNADLETVIRHEMGHVLGIGTLWDDLVQPRPCPSAGEPHYVGQHGVAEWHSYGASGDVPVEDDYGQGTDCGHWDEEELHFELMTGILDADMRLSRITIGSLEDLGFSVDYSAADSYPLLPSQVRPQDEPGFEIQERLITPIR